METKENYWLGKSAKIFILKDGKDLIFTAKIVEIDENHISFIDKFGITFSFNRKFVNEMKEIEEGD